MARSSSVDLDSPDRPFDNIINFRDVGRTINQVSGASILKEGILYRSARPDDASERDKRRLADEFHIATVLDLRSTTEHKMATRKRRAENENTGTEIDLTNTPSGNADEHLVQIPAQRCLISLAGKAMERTLLWRLDWTNYIKAIAMTATGYRNDAIRLVAEQVMQPRGLTGLAQDTLDASKSELRCIFELLAVQETYPILVHCTQGKDRTGLVILMMMLLAGDQVSRAAIIDDYTRSELELVPEFEERMREISALGLSEDYTRCPPGFVDDLIDYLDTHYRGVSGYLACIGIDLNMQEKIREKIMST